MHYELVEDAYPKWTYMAWVSWVNKRDYKTGSGKLSYKEGREGSRPTHGVELEPSQR